MSCISYITNSRYYVKAMSLAFASLITRPGTGDDARGGEEGNTIAVVATVGGMGVSVGTGAGAGTGTVGGVGGGDDNDNGGTGRLISLGESLRAPRDAVFDFLD
ncbi:hypothetical protein BU23DRAFT_573151 [Bimuria novae-zelandiae CBS 107.79]|uniref:Uncharacterized protein n=1 Tax=Bimuria novae-zelandiae CBS 107.79 TaxID=1447943 RepID=A0A6A5UU92_9PLEO|nr:hypothetical protein BU23DRAFT_573151 [Bimuria novae-zelandiae CBS 107.79]